MHRKIFLISLVIAVSAQFNLTYGQDFNFRNTRWGMSQEQVMAAEKMDPIEKSENHIKYKTTILDRNVHLLYLFVDDKLIGASYTLDEIYLNSAKYRQTYNTFKRALIDKFDEPNSDITTWINDTYKNDPSKWGLAVGLGHVEYSATWNTQDSAIRCSLTGENHNILCKIKFSAVEYKDLEKMLNQKKETDIF